MNPRTTIGPLPAPVFDQYLRLDVPAGTFLDACPCCGSAPELWQYQKGEDASASKAVMCSLGEPIGPQGFLSNEGCPLYLPCDDFYHSTIREAAKYWNEYACALTTVRDLNTRKGGQEQAVLQEQPWVRKEERTLVLLMLVGGHDVTPEAIAGWTDTECQQAEEWAMREHLHASDNDEVERVPMPACVKAHPQQAKPLAAGVDHLWER
jgi:hypothetical protein